jgi:hypothetical protein
LGSGMAGSTRRSRRNSGTGALADRAPRSFGHGPTYAMSLARYMPIDDYVFYEHLRPIPY